MRKNKKQIVFVGSGIPDMLTKIAIKFKKKGYETIFISLVKNEEIEFLKDGYDRIISFDLKFFKITIFNLSKIFFYIFDKIPKIIQSYFEIKKLKPYVLINIATPNWLCFLSKKYFKNSPFIYFPFDIRSFSYKDKNEAFALGIPKFEVNAESWNFNNSDGIIHKGNKNELKQINLNVLGNIKIRCPDILFFPYCSEELNVSLNKDKISKKDKKTHIVYVGHIPLDENWWEGIKEFTKQNIYVHLYSKTNNLTKSEEKMRVKNNLHNKFKDNFIILHESVSQKDLAKEISKYDYGIYSFSIRKGKDYEITTGNKIASYLEAGLPIICLSQFKTMARLLKKHKIGVIIEPEKIDQVKFLLKKSKPKKFERNILKARIELGMNKHIPRLEKFFEEVIQYKKKQELGK